MSRAGLLLALAALCGVPACSPAERADETRMGGDTVSDPLERAQARVTRKVIDIDGVTGTAIGLCDGKPCIKIYVESASDGLRRRLPTAEGDYPVVVEVTGRFRGR